MHPSTRQRRIVLTGLGANLLLIGGFAAAIQVSGPAQEIMLITTSVASVVALLAGVFVQGWGLTCLFLVPALLYGLAYGGWFFFVI